MGDEDDDDGEGLVKKNSRCDYMKSGKISDIIFPFLLSLLWFASLAHCIYARPLVADVPPHECIKHPPDSQDQITPMANACVVKRIAIDCNEFPEHFKHAND